MSAIQENTNVGRSAIDKAQERLTVSQLIRYFAADLPRTSNYPRHAKAYINYCLTQQFAIDGFSFARYTADLPPNRVSPIRKFLLFYQLMGSPAIMPDPTPVKISAAANELVLRFIREVSSLRGERSKDTYTKALNAFFIFVDQQHQLALEASLGGLTVNEFVLYLKENNYSAFTVNLYLSAVKQLANWCIRRREELRLTQEQLNALRDINDVRGLAVERTFYKDSLESTERDQLLAGTASARDKAILALLAIEGLRTVEVTRLKLADLDFDRQQLMVLGKGKNTKKAIKFFVACRDILQQYLTEKGCWPIPANRRQEFLFEQIKTHQIRYIVDKHLRQSGLKREGMSAHSLRHTVGQLLLEQGVHLEHVQQHLRHETLDTTQFYTKKKTRKTYFEQMPA